MTSPNESPHGPITPVPHGIAADQITIPDNRQRCEITEPELSDLATSIAAIGLLHPIVVRQEGDRYVLVAGERRLRAMRLLAVAQTRIRVGDHHYPLGHFPCTLLGELSPEEAHEAELEENIRRVDLSLQDRVKAIEALHRLRRLRNPEQTTMDTGGEAFPDFHPKVGQQKVREALIIAQHLDNPDVAKAKTEREAMKVINRASQAAINERLAAAVGRLAASELHEVHHADATDWLATAPDAKFNCILIDPPYGMDAADFGDAAGRLTGIQHNYVDDSSSFRSLMGTIAPQLTRVAKPESHLYVWCDIDGFHFLRSLFEQHGWWCFRTPLINVKREGGRVPWPEHGPRRCYELVLFAVRGKLPVTAIYRDVFDSTLSEGNLGHGAQKPVEAYVELLKRSCRPGDLVLDCFGGTGTLLAAAQALKLRAVVVEKEANAYGMCLARLKELE